VHADNVQKKPVIPAHAGLRRQDAGANIRAAVFNSGAGHGPKGEPRMAASHPFSLFRQINMDSRLCGNDGKKGGIR
jgi:hypothetical protein